MMEERLSELQDAHDRLVREKKCVEERAAHLSEQLLQEEEKSKQAHKHRQKADGQLNDVEQKLEKETRLRHELERAKQKVEVELQEQQEAIEESQVKIAELNQHLMKVQDELSKTLTKYVFLLF